MPLHIGLTVVSSHGASESPSPAAWNRLGLARSSRHCVRGLPLAEQAERNGLDDLTVRAGSMPASFFFVLTVPNQQQQGREHQGELQLQHQLLPLSNDPLWLIQIP